MTDPVHVLNSALEGRYQIEQKLGEGGMATVYLADDLRHDRKVALKVLKPELAAVIGADRFLTEIRTTAKLQHPHILALFDSGDVDGLLFYVMPFVEGESLREKMDREKHLPVEEAVRLGREVADALAYAHRQGVIHRDIKPENVLLQDGRAVVADFGIALAVTAAGGTRLTETGLSLGTPSYMSPEQATGDQEVDGRTDIYAVGCLMYEMLAGQPPHLGTTAQAILAKVLTSEPEPVSAIRETVPPPVAYAIHRAMARLPADRFVDAEEFLAALSGTSTGTTWTPVASAERMGATPNRRTSLVLGTLLLVALALAAWGWAGRTSVEGVRRVAVPPPRGLSFVPDGYLPALSPDGETVVFAARDSVGMRLYRRPVDGFEAVPIEGTEGAEYPFFSPDGQWVGFLREAPREIRKVLLEGGPSVLLAPLNAARNEAVWRTDGTIVFSWERQGLWSVSEEGGAVTQLTLPDTAADEFDHLRPQELPDGRLLFAVAMGAAYRMGRSNELRSAILEPGSEEWELLPGPAGGMYHPGGLMLVEAGTWSVRRYDLAAPERAEPAIPILGGTLDGGRQHPTPVSFSRLGDMAYFAGVGEAGWMLTGVDTTGTVRPLHPVAGAYRWPRVSPDGTRLMVGRQASDGWGLWMLDLETGAFRPFTTEVGSPGEAAWSADGQEIAFTVEDNPDQSLAAIYARNTDGTGEDRLLVAESFDAWTSAWSSDRRHLAFYGGPEQSDVWVKELGDGGELHQVTTGPSTERHPEFSPDGAWIAYQSDRSGRYEIYVKGFPDVEREYLVSIDGGTEPMWSGDRSEIIFRNGSRIMVAPVDLEDGFSVGAPRVLVSTFMEDDVNGDLSYDVMPDGRSFVIIRSDPSTQPELRIIRGWVDETVERLGGGSP